MSPRMWFLSACLSLAPGLARAAPPAITVDDLRTGRAPITADQDIPAIGLGHDDDAVAAYNTPTLLFVNMGGAKLNSGCGNNSKNDCSSLGGLFGWEILPFTGDLSRQAAVVQAVREDVVDFGVIVIGERPPSNQNYAMVMLGNGVTGGQDFAGIAPFIDCGNSNPNVTSFSLEMGGNNTMATIIHQEAAHTWGLEHIDNEQDNLHPFVAAVDPKYTDSCDKIVSNTDLDPTSGQCNSVHTNFCSSGYQNSYQEMLLLFGPPIADTTPPTVTIEAPTEGQEFSAPAAFDLIITLDDDRRPATLSTDILLNGESVTSGVYVNTTLKFPVNGLPAGEYTFVVNIEDESDNPASDSVSFSVLPGADTTTTTDTGDTSAGTTGDSGGTTSDGSGTDGSGTDGSGSDGSGAVTASGGFTTAGGDRDGDDGCACRARAPSTGSLALWLPLLLRRRRRSRSRIR